MTEFTFFTQLAYMDYQTLLDRSFRFAVIDDDDARIGRDEMSVLNAQGKSLWGYISTGEAESYRSYWTDLDFAGARSELIIGATPNWDNSYRVKFWREEWQQIVLDRVETIVRDGYAGGYFDVVGIYNVPEVRAAYLAEFPGGDVRLAMEDFVIRISEFAKSLNPDFKIVMQNAVALLSTTEIINPADPLTPNTRILDYIDGVGKESTFAFDDVYPLPWTPWDARYVENAINAGKFVVGLEYPTTDAAANYSLSAMIAAGYIPFLDLYADKLSSSLYYAAFNRLVPGLVSETLVQQAAGNPLAGTPLTGSAAHDVLVGNAYPDIVRGFAGNDTVYANDGNDMVLSGDGDDVVFGWNGDDYIHGGTGNDALLGDDGNDTIMGGTGNNLLFGWLGNDVLSADAGNDFIAGEQGDDSITAGLGNDTIYAGSEADYVLGDVTETSALGDGADVILGDAGNDTLFAGGGNDTVFGGADNDSINAGTGDDVVGGDAGNDTVDAGDGNDSLFGWEGEDSLLGGAGADLISGEEGNDTAWGGEGDDTLYGGDGLDMLGGDADDDVLFGLDDDDRLFGWDGNDTIDGGTGADLLMGEAGDDRLIGGSGDDTLWGGAGADVFVYTQGTGADAIADFVQGMDKIEMLGGSFAVNIAPNFAVIAGNTVLSLGAGGTLTLWNIVNLGADDFLFA